MIDKWRFVCSWGASSYKETLGVLAMTPRLLSVSTGPHNERSVSKNESSCLVNMPLILLVIGFSEDSPKGAGEMCLML